MRVRGQFRYLKEQFVTDRWNDLEHSNNFSHLYDVTDLIHGAGTHPIASVPQNLRRISSP